MINIKIPTKQLQKNSFPCRSIMSDTNYAMPAISGVPESATTT